MASAYLPPDVAHRVNVLCNAGYAPAAAADLATTPVGAFGAALIEAGYARRDAVEITLACPLDRVMEGAPGAKGYADMFALCNVAGLPDMAMGFFRAGTTRPQAQSALARTLADASDALVTDSQPTLETLESIRHGQQATTAQAIWRRRKGQA